MSKSMIDEYIKWMENHKIESTNIYRKPRRTIRQKNLTKTEMTEEEEKECRLGIWWSNFPIERKIYEQYANAEMEEIPEKYRAFIQKMRILFSNEKDDKIQCIENNRNDEKIMKRNSIVQMSPISKNESYVKIDERYYSYLKWIKEHKYDLMSRYKVPRLNISRDEKLLRMGEMTEEELEEYKLSHWWLKSKEKKILEKYLHISDYEFGNLPEIIKKVILLYSETGIRNKYNVVERMRLCVKNSVENNSEVRKELTQRENEFEQQNERGKEIDDK